MGQSSFHQGAAMVKGIIWTILLFVTSSSASMNQTQEGESSSSGGRLDRQFSVFNVVTFPNSVCAASSGYNGTCYSSSECSAKGGTASGSCASSFGVCCVFSVSCGSTMSQNNSYAIISSYSTSSDADPCIYTICKSSSDICKIRIDFDTMVLSDPFSTTSTAVLLDGGRTGKCRTDTLQVINPGHVSSPIICGYNTGQHMFVPASDECNRIHINIDTGSTTTTRKWQIKTTQYTCESEMAPRKDCLQYHTAQYGTFASFGWDTSASTVATSQTHLVNQQYDVCIRRSRSYCSICYTPYIISSTTGTGSSYGLSAGSDADAQKSAIGSFCSGVTIVASADTTTNVGHGDYLEIANMQPGPASSSTYVEKGFRLCGSIFNVITTATIAQGTVCSFTVPFKVGVHMDDGEAIGAGTVSKFLTYENDVKHTSGAGHGYAGFYLSYWQVSC